MILQENIEYNDLLNTIEDEKLARDDVKNDEQATENKYVKPKSGKFSIINFLFVIKLMQSELNTYHDWWERKEVRYDLREMD